MVWLRVAFMPDRRPAGLLAWLLCLSACSPGAPAPSNATPATPAAIDIPVTDGRPLSEPDIPAALQKFTGDVDALIDRGVIRLLVTPAGPTFNFAPAVAGWPTPLRPSNVRQPAHRATQHPVVVIAASETSIVGDVIAGQADISANLLRTFDRDDRLAFARPWRSGVREIVVTGPGIPPLVSLEDIGGRTIHVRKNSDHHASLLRLNDQLKKIDRPPARIVTAPESQSDEDLLELVNTGRVPATLADDYIYDRWRRTLDKLSANPDVAVSQDGEFGWAVRKDAPRLLALVNEFFSTHRLTF